MKEFLRKIRIYLFPTEAEIQEVQHLPEVKKILEMLHQDTSGWRADRMKYWGDQVILELQCLRKLPLHQRQLAKIFLDREAEEVQNQSKERLNQSKERLSNYSVLEKQYTTWRWNYQKLEKSYPRLKDYELQMKKLNQERHEMEKELEALEKESGLR